MRIALVLTLALGMIPFGCKQEQPPAAQVVEQRQPYTPIDGNPNPTPMANVGPVVNPPKDPVKPPKDPVVKPSDDKTPVVGGKTYTIKSGDTLYKISRTVYGNDSKVKAIQQLNPELDPAKLPVGKTIKLPQ